MRCIDKNQSADSTAHCGLYPLTLSLLAFAKRAHFWPRQNWGYWQHRYILPSAQVDWVFYLLANQLIFYVALENLNKILQGSKDHLENFPAPDWIVVAFGAIENSAEILVEARDFSHPATDFLCCTQEPLRTNQAQRLLTFYAKGSDQKELILCTLFCTVPKRAPSAYASCRFGTKAPLGFCMRNKNAIQIQSPKWTPLVQDYRRMMFLDQATLLFQILNYIRLLNR